MSAWRGPDSLARAVGSGQELDEIVAAHFRRLRNAHQVQQGTFTGAVDTDNTILVALFYVKCNIFTQQSVAIAVRQILCTSNHFTYLPVKNLHSKIISRLLIKVKRTNRQGSPFVLLFYRYL